MTYLFVDGSNLYSAQYNLFGPDRYLNFKVFIKQLEKNINIKFDKVFFYGSYTPRKKNLFQIQQKYLINEFKFYQSVKLVKNLIFFKGYRSKTSGKEKEVDVRLSVDLVGFGLLEKYKKAYLFSGDADFLQAVFFVLKYRPNINLNLICMENRILYKGLYYLPSYILSFSSSFIPDKRIARKAKVIYLKKTADLCPRLR